MSAQQLLLTIATLWPWGLIKVILLILLMLYIIVAGICFRQIDLMNQMVEAQISPVLRMIGLIHLLAAIIIFLMAVVLL